MAQTRCIPPTAPEPTSPPLQTQPQNRVPPLDNPLLQAPLGRLTLSSRLKMRAPQDFATQTRRSPPTGLERPKSDQILQTTLFCKVTEVAVS